MEELVDALDPVEVVHLSEIVDRAKTERSTAGLCAITVDDGMARAVAGTVGLCQRRGWPATFFLPTVNIDRGAGFAYEWWRQVQSLLPGRRLRLPSGSLDLSDPHMVSSLSVAMERLWHSAPLDLYAPLTMELVDAVAEELGVPMDTLRPPRPVTWEEVEQLAKNDQFRFESHGVSHVAMSALKDQELHWELKASRDKITEHTGRPCRHLAYPFGSQQSIGTLAPTVARLYYDSAVTMNLGGVDDADPWLLPRVPLYPKNSKTAARLKVLLTCSRLTNHRPKKDAHTLAPVGAADHTANSGPGYP
jgi:peptidoglycan/xylan/chitin deacetylase (PgdA/CDA1 family)